MLYNIGGGRLGSKEILALARPQFGGLATYLAIKGLDGTGSAQLELLHQLAESFRDGNGYEGVEAIIREYAHHLPEEGIVGGKVAQVSRMGFDLVDKRFGEMAKGIYARNELPVLLAYAALLGFESFTRELPEGMAVGIVNPKTAADGMETFGYKIWADNGSVNIEMLSKGSNLGSLPAVLVDDTRRSGNTFDCAKNFFDGIDHFPTIRDETYVISVPQSK